ncbi:DUF3846 domain-containing protein [Streptomyces sp. NPDC007875]|uniref:DUF3846 domain-containing protein n=1 Tax=Streptomyces sp. NPDC007875 TaxID=3364783 RepID=UPI0036A4EE3B
MTSTPGALLVTPEVDIVPIGLPATPEEQLTVMYSLLRCHFVDVVRLTDQMDMWLDDGGAYTQPVNKLATVLAMRFGRTSQPYYGPVMLAGRDAKGDTVPLSRDKLTALLTSIEDLL